MSTTSPTPPEPFRPIAGGPVPPERVIGRDQLIDRIWERLAVQSVVLVSERRIGKTSVLRKMEAEPRDGWTALYTVVESVRRPQEFVGKVVDAIGPLRKGLKGVGARLLGLWNKYLGGERVGDFSLPNLSLHWKEMLTAALEDLDDIATEDGVHVALFWDELPVMVDNLRRENSREATELLDTLRNYRQQHPDSRVRMVYAGSIGLHLVVSALRRTGYVDDPTNDMHVESLEGLLPSDAEALAVRGLGALVRDGDLRLRGEFSELAFRVATLTDGLPYYVDKVVLELTDLEQPVTPSSAELAVKRLIRDPNDQAHFGHYAERIEVYYDFDDLARPIAMAVLDALAHAGEPLDEDALWRAVTSQVEVAKQRRMHHVLKILAQDHYVTRQWEGETRRWAFKYRLIQRWWRDIQAA